MKTFKEYLIETNTFSEEEINALNENLKSELTEAEEAKIDKNLKIIWSQSLNKLYNW